MVIIPYISGSEKNFPARSVDTGSILGIHTSWDKRKIHGVQEGF
jgi:hypothetical protein